MHKKIIIAELVECANILDDNDYPQYADTITQLANRIAQYEDDEWIGKDAIDVQDYNQYRNEYQELMDENRERDEFGDTLDEYDEDGNKIIYPDEDEDLDEGEGKLMDEMFDQDMEDRLSGGGDYDLY
jgi:hypothetical protein